MRWLCIFFVLLSVLVSVGHFPRPLHLLDLDSYPYIPNSCITMWLAVMRQFIANARNRINCLLLRALRSKWLNPLAKFLFEKGVHPHSIVELRNKVSLPRLLCCIALVSIKVQCVSIGSCRQPFHLIRSKNHALRQVDIVPKFPFE